MKREAPIPSKTSYVHEGYSFPCAHCYVLSEKVTADDSLLDC
jgi:hypothetical protein